MRISDTREPALGLAAPAELVASLADTLDVMVDQPLAGLAIFGEDPPTIGRYTIERRLGVGATAVVYAARDTLLDRRVALKIVIGRDADGTWRERVLREARALACLSHPNVVAVREVGEWRGHPFIAMELVAGVTLAHWQATEPRAWAAILRHYLAAGRGLEAAHAAGLVHRDFKPANVLVSDAGRVVVTDFGLAALAEPAAGRAATAAGTGVRSKATVRRRSRARTSTASPSRSARRSWDGIPCSPRPAIGGESPGASTRRSSAAWPPM
jgi:serine/threonine protein kinase